MSDQQNDTLDGATTAVTSISSGRKWTIGALSAVAIGLVVAIFALSGGNDDPEPATAAGTGVDVAAVAVELSQYNYELLDGTPTDLSQYAGKPIVVNFYASWCGPCRAELPDFEQVSQDLTGTVQFTSLAVNDRPEDAQRIIDESGVTYPVGQDSAALIEKFDGFAMPSTVFIAADGRVLDTHLGELTASELTAKIEELLL